MSSSPHRCRQLDCEISMPTEDECRKQSQAVAAADRNDPELMAWLDATRLDLLDDEGELGTEPASTNER